MKSFYFFIGTKAQAIKSIPLMSKIQEDSNFNVILVDSGQHFLITEKIFDSYNFKTLKLHSSNRNISTYIGGLSWVFKFIFRNILFKNKNLSIDRSNRGTCVVHGDTMSTLLGMLWAKRNNLKVLHLESGLTSSDIFNPFPEEIIRRIVSKYSDILICFDEKSHELLINKYSKTKKVIKRISTNTIVDTISQENTLVDKNLITVTMHRNENLLSRKRVKRLIELLSKINNSYEINWYLHEPTENMLKKRKPSIPKNVKLLSLISHDEFLNEIKKSHLIITDGGSIQEECFYLNKNAIVWRKSTERPYALNDRIHLANYDLESSLKHIEKISNFTEDSKTSFKSPSSEIVEFIRLELNQNG